MMKSSKQQVLNYKEYKMNIRETICSICEGMFIVALFGYFFYRSVIITVLGMPLVYFYIRWKKKRYCDKQKQDLQIQFKEALISIKGSLQAGYSLENAFCESYKDMAIFYGPTSIIARELKEIEKGLSNGNTINKMIFDLGERSGVEDIKEFAEVMIIGKQTGGNLLEIMDSFIIVLEEKVNVLQEIDAMVSARKFEQKIMDGVPFFIIFYLELTSKGFFSVLYEGIAGRIVMTICMLIYIASVYMSSRITDITI